MEVHIAPDLQEQLEQTAARQGRDAEELVQEALARYLAEEALYSEAQEGWTDDERQAAMSHIEEGFLQAERGELIDGDQARHEIEAFKDNWRKQRQSTQ
jgi:predicted transcriptional regulator